MQTDPNNPQNTGTTPSTTLKVVVLIVLIILLAIGIILPIKLVPNAFTTIGDKIGSWFDNDESFVLSTDKSLINSGETITLSWENAPKNEGTYALSYSCAPGVAVQTSIVFADETVVCDGNYYFSPSTNSIAVAIISTTTRYAEVTLSLGFLENGATTTDMLDAVVIGVNNTSASGVTVSPKPTTTPKATTSPVVTVKPTVSPTKSPTPTKTPSGTVTRTNRVSNPYGYSDLSVRIVATGYLTDSGDFVPAASVASYQRPAVKFVVTNVGDKNSGTWGFLATLPTPYHPSYSAINRSNLGPGDSIAYVLGFDGINNSRVNTVRIDIMPNRTVGDSNSTNNFSQTTITNISASY